MCLSAEDDKTPWFCNFQILLLISFWYLQIMTKVSLEMQLSRLNIIYPWRLSSFHLSLFLVRCLRRHDCQSETIRKLTVGSAGFSRQFQPHRIWSRISEIQRKGGHLKIKMWAQLSFRIRNKFWLRMSGVLIVSPLIIIKYWWCVAKVKFFYNRY